MRMEQPDYIFEKFNSDLCIENRTKLQNVSSLALTKSQVLNVAGSSHVNKPYFVTQLREKFWAGVDRKQLYLSPGTIWGFPGKGLKDGNICDQIVANVRRVSEQDGYNGQILVLVLGTNDASEVYSPTDLKMFKGKCRDFYIRLLEIPGLFLMPCGLLPRLFQKNRPRANPNMYYSNCAVKEVCQELRSGPLYRERIKFTDINHDIAEVVPAHVVPNPDVVPVPTTVPFKGMLLPDNVHLTHEGNQKMIENMLRAINLIPGSIFGIPPPPRKK
jgi:hypothetical protein